MGKAIAKKARRESEHVTTFRSHGVDVSLYLPDAADHIQKCIRRDRAFYEGQMLEHIRARLSPGTLALDVGANIGNHTVFLAKVCELNVISLEPGEHCFKILTRNIELNALQSRVTAYRKAAGQSAGRGVVVEAAPQNLGQTRVEQGPDGEIEVVPIDALTIDLPVSLLKVDVEGMELEVLKGAAKTIERHRPLIYVEAQQREQLRAIQVYLSQFAYGALAEFNWTPTYLFAPCGTSGERFSAIMTRLDRMEAENDQEVKNARRWRAQAEELHTKRAQLLGDFERQKAAYLETKDNCARAQSDAKRWQHAAGELNVKHDTTLRDLERQTAACLEIKDRCTRAQSDVKRWRHAAGELSAERDTILRDLECLKSDPALAKAKSQLATSQREFSVACRENSLLSSRLRQNERQHVTEIAALGHRKSKLQQELNETMYSTRYRIGDAMIRAARLSTDTLKLPLRLWRIYRERPSDQLDLTRSNMESSVNQTAVVERNRRLLQEFRQFMAKVAQGKYGHAVVIFGGTTYIQSVRANRPIRLARSFASMDVPVLFNFHRYEETDHIPDYDGGLIFQSPTDKTPGLVERLVREDLGETRVALIVSYPFPTVCRLINLANINGWATLYDCRDDWDEFQKVQMARWHKPSIEKYVVNNCDVTCCVSRVLQEKMRSYTTTRPVYLSPNAYDPEFLDDDYVRRPADRVTIGYFGHLTDRWFDWQSLDWIARQRPNYQFEIIGHAAPKKLQLPVNVQLLGPKTHTEICKIAASWHVGIIAFKVGRLADGVDPIKIYEYFGLGLPVVSFRMPQISDYPYTTTVETREQFVEALDRAAELECDPNVFEQFVQTHTWDNRSRELIRWIDEALDRPACEKTFHEELAVRATL